MQQCCEGKGAKERDPVEIDIDIVINTEIQFGESVCHGGWLIGPKLFRSVGYLACASSKLCEFIVEVLR